MDPNREGQRYSDPEVDVVVRERDRLRHELKHARDRFRRFAEARGRFATSMRTTMSERRSLDLQYAVQVALERCGGLDEAATAVLDILGREFAPRLSVVWSRIDGELAPFKIWRPKGAPAGGLERALRETRSPTGVGARVRDAGAPLWVPDLAAFGDLRSGAAAGDGVQTALAFPVSNSGGLLWVVEVFGVGGEAPDEGLIRTLGILGSQVAQVIERKRAEEALRESEAFVSAVNDTVSVGIAVMDLAAGPRIVYCNPAAGRIMGLPADRLGEASGDELLRAVHPDDREGFVAFFERCRRTGAASAARHEYRVRHRDGSYLWVETSGVAFERGETPGSPATQSLFVFEDISEREALRRETEDERGRLEAVLQQMPGGVFISDLSGRIFLANRGSERIYGRRIASVEECGRHSRNYPDERELRDDEHPLVRALGGESVSAAQHYVLRPDGSRRVISANAAPVRNAAGAVVAAVKVVEDITERKRIEEALAENEEWLRLAERASRSGTWEWDLASGEIRWSREHLSLFGFDEEGDEGGTLTRERWWGTVHPDDVALLERAGRLCAERGAQWPELEYRISRADSGERRWIEARGRTVFEAGRPARILGISVDVTERRRAQRERERLRALEVVAEAQAAERRSISRELHDRVAHDMAIVHQNLQLFAALRETDPDRAAAKLAAAERGAREALDATRSLSSELRGSEAEEGLQKALEEFVWATAEAQREDGSSRGVRTSIRVTGDDGDLPVHLREQAYLILREAIRNALKHSRCSRLDVSVRVSPTGITGSVTDDGTGFDAQYPRGGVGLRSMRERVELLGGTFHLQTSAGGGTRVEIALDDARGARL